MRPDIYGVAKIRFVVPLNVSDFTLTASYSNQLDAQKVSISIAAVAYQSRDNKVSKYLQVETSTENAIIGRFAIISVQSNFYMHSFFYLVSGGYPLSRFYQIH